MNDLCRRCGKFPRIKNERYCRPCRYAMLREFVLSGYLQDTYVRPYWSDERGRNRRAPARPSRLLPEDDYGEKATANNVCEDNSSSGSRMRA